MLQESDTVGVFPTPIDQILSAANVQEIPDQTLDPSFLSRMRSKAEGALKSALKKVLGLFDSVSRFIFIDKQLYIKKQNFVRLHEAGHAFMPWQNDSYKLVEESELTLSEEIADQFDVEANVFASEVIFQNDAFIKEAVASSFSIKVPMRLAKKFDASIYASIRQYVSKHYMCCTVLVFDMPAYNNGAGFTCSLRRCVSSQKFMDEFSNVQWPSILTPDYEISSMIPLGNRRMSGQRQFALVDDNGISHEFTAEGFTNTYQVFVLLHENKALTETRVIF